jgi:hypothetical protein
MPDRGRYIVSPLGQINAVCITASGTMSEDKLTFTGVVVLIA